MAQECGSQLFQCLHSLLCSQGIVVRGYFVVKNKTKNNKFIFGNVFSHHIVLIYKTNCAVVKIFQVTL